MGADGLGGRARAPRGGGDRPTVTLSLLLKLGRLSEQDLWDSLAAIRRARMEGLGFDAGRVLAALAVLPPAGDAAPTHRRVVLRDALEAGRAPRHPA